MPHAPYTPRDVAMLCQGDEVYGVGTIQRLYAAGWPEATFVCFAEGALVDHLRSIGARVERVEGLKSFIAGGSLATLAALPARAAEARKTALGLDALLRERGVRIIHTHWLPQQLVAAWMRPLGYKSVWQINNNTDSRRLLGLGPRLNRRLARWGADLLLPASEFIAANWRGAGVPIETVRNAAPPLGITPAAPPAPPLRCVAAGRLEPSKGHHVAVEAVLAARRAGHDVALDVYGGPIEGNPYADALRARIAQEGATDAVRLVGFASDLRRRHADYHLALQCRIDPEPCSLWVCETLVDGLPMAASATGGTPELVADGETGFLYPAGDDAALAERIIRFAREPGLADRMSAAALARGRERFLDARFRDQTLAAYNAHLGS